ncbi:putative sporulation sigma-E factor-processing peptidase [Clostridium pasteurianum DSM 525 = ATCC 6013]|uniref:Sporulation sigma-E factor-processing peptidase n=1 Tax=Clostridium pasteurianum DSM 525 = ATCC 6013 TaxID=1262449 RepID=A0A0H3J8F9_CLOPA|nr:sigma-E processing peptidase SpoIIGA [Clostridium pasteurianum]AJA48203.1 putative sporulation sigma-E factor-processing peptidase [Clostridium pasteurianum DSM 525 = ATCC 6013]AJA52191.1 putative sporulation sigma-E factor-processing peptidase [Clostridium pasteurianum DSM 525 = ATCC 6013]AOZ75462.1 sporulation sigma-E factor-processing peptidase [Clostridium pasteurianum DSM 525 = ATCC 6013]AOZ79257.1 sporulation sigma-E factor-processing peptidase [Clostridium pasteurianum]ELP60645.1 Spo
MVVYLDILIIENLIVNMFLLYITSQTLKIKIKLQYLLAAALLGSMYVLTIIYPLPKLLSSIGFKFFVALLMIIVVFRKSNVIFNIKAAAIFILYSMMTAGFCIFIEFYFSKGLTFDNMPVFSYKYILCSIMILYITIHRIIIFIKDRKEIVSFIYDVDIMFDEKKKRVKAFLDTGNELREPLTNLPVMIVERSILKDINIKEKDMFYIPFKVVNGSGGYLKGFKPSNVNIYKNSMLEKTELIVAVCDTKLSDLNDYNALLSRGII